jgi:adenylate kinase
MIKWPTILLFGAPGSGKGTQAKFLSSIAPLCHVSTGDIFRSIPKGSNLAKKFQTYSSQGLLAPDDLTLQVWYDFVQGLIHTFLFNPDKQILLLDGLPRTLNQAKSLEDFLDIKMILELKINDETSLIGRLQKRSQIEGRIDDSQVSVIQNRMSIYNEQIQEIRNYYTLMPYISINAESPPLTVLGEILPYIQTLFDQRD